MIVEIRNFGPIDYLEIDLTKDLHLIYGENSIGKSYATYVLYCLIKNVKNRRVRGSYYYNLNEESKFNSFFKNQLTRLKKSTSKKVDISSQYRELMRSDLDSLFSEAFQNSLLNSFSSLKNLKNRYSNKNYEIGIRLRNKFRFQFISDDGGNIRVEIPIDFNKLEIIQKDTKSTKFSFYQGGKKMFGKPSEDQLGRELESNYINTLNLILDLIDNDTRDVYYLPASRSGLYQALNAFTPIIAELTQNRFFIQNKSIELPSLPEPLSDYFIDLSTLNKKDVNKEFNDLIAFIQTNILRGEVFYDDKKRQIMFKPLNLKLELNISESSSMVAEISPIVLYLKHIINHKYASSRNRDPYYFDPYYTSNKKGKGSDILFIEEPEAHLHPEVQVLLMEAFAKLIGGKIKVFMTSHSNYMFNKLNNIILKKEISVDKISVYHLIGSKQGTVQDKQMSVTKEGIMDENFRETSEKLYSERMESVE